MTDIFNKKNLERSYKFDIFRAFREAEISRNELNKIGFKISKHSWTACLNDSNIGNLFIIYLRKKGTTQIVPTKRKKKELNLSQKK